MKEFEYILDPSFIRFILDRSFIFPRKLLDGGCAQGDPVRGWPSDRRFAEIGELADAGDALLAASEISGPWSERRVDLLRDPASLDCSEHSLALLDLLEDGP